MHRLPPREWPWHGSYHSGRCWWPHACLACGPANQEPACHAATVVGSGDLQLQQQADGPQTRDMSAWLALVSSRVLTSAALESMAAPQGTYSQGYSKKCTKCAADFFQDEAGKSECKR